MRDKMLSFLSKHLNKEKTTHRNIHSTYGIISRPNPSYYSLSLLLSSQWIWMEYNGISTTSIFTMHCKSCCSSSSSSMKLRTLPWKIRKKEQGYSGISVNEQLTTALNMKSKCITGKHTHKCQMIIIYRGITGLLPQIYTFFPNQWMNFSVLRPYFTKIFKTHFHISLCL